MNIESFLPSKILTFGIQPAKITVVCCLHGEEVFGNVIFNYLKDHANDFTSLNLILAHPTALKRKQRFLEQDLNRSFPGNAEGTVEAKLAHALMSQITDTNYVIDIHTTISDMRMSAIITSLNKTTRHLINLSSAYEIAFIQPPLKNKSMIGQIEHGISLEYNRNYAQTEDALQDVIHFLHQLEKEETQKPQNRKLLVVDGDIPKNIPLPKTARNFYRVRGLNVYPFLYHPESYETIHALSASKVRYVKI